MCLFPATGNEVVTELLAPVPLRGYRVPSVQEGPEESSNQSQDIGPSRQRAIAGKALVSDMRNRIPCQV